MFGIRVIQAFDKDVAENDDNYVMGYRLVTGLYVANYICLAPELLLTDYGSR